MPSLPKGHNIAHYCSKKLGFLEVFLIFFDEGKSLLKSDGNVAFFAHFRSVYIFSLALLVGNGAAAAVKFCLVACRWQLTAAPTALEWNAHFYTFFSSDLKILFFDKSFLQDSVACGRWGMKC